MFIERDARIFRLVIKFMRCWGDPNEFDADSLTDNDRTLFLNEMQYWGISQQLLLRSKSLRSTFVPSISNGNAFHNSTTFTQTIDQKFDLTTPPKSGLTGLNLSPPPNVASGFKGGHTNTSSIQTTSTTRTTATKQVAKVQFATATSASNLEASAIKSVVESIWGTYDRDNNGELDRAEAMRFIKSTLSALTASEGASAGDVQDSAIQQAFDSIDADKSGMVDKPEMVTIISKLLNGGTL